MTQKLAPWVAAVESVLSELCESSGIGERAPLSDMPAFFVAYICGCDFARFCELVFVVF